MLRVDVRIFKTCATAVWIEWLTTFWARSCLKVGQCVKHVITWNIALGLIVCLCFWRPVRQVWHAVPRLVSLERCSVCTHMSYITCCLVSPPTCTVQLGRRALLRGRLWRQSFKMCHSGIQQHPTAKEVTVLTLISWFAAEFMVEQLADLPYVFCLISHHLWSFIFLISDIL